MKENKIAVIGLGYVGLPLAALFAQKYAVVGFDIAEWRIEEINKGIDRSGEVESEKLKAVLKQENNSENGLFTSGDAGHMADCNYFVITVPTPIDEKKNPDLTPLRKSSELVGKYLKMDDIVIYESTTYPGCTEDVCVPILEENSNLKFNKDFFVGYSPERINPGDKKHRVHNIVKVTSGSTPETAEKVDQLYASVIEAGTCPASSIKVAEAAKVIENTQRDINIAFVNELAKIFHLLDIDTLEVLKVAGSKWNFLPFKPGLVGGHCIGVDPYYLAQKAVEVGHHPEMILAGRRINDTMGDYVAQRIVKEMIKSDINIKNSKVLLLGIAFKENTPDIRNTRVVDVKAALEDYEIHVDVHDPVVEQEEVQHEFGFELNKNLNSDFDAVVLCVAHNEFKTLNLNDLKKDKGIIFDVKGFLTESEAVRL